MFGKTTVMIKVLIATLLSCVCLNAANITLNWQPAGPTTEKYRVYFGEPPDSPIGFREFVEPSGIFFGIKNTTYFQIFAVDFSGEETFIEMQSYVDPRIPVIVTVETTEGRIVDRWETKVMSFEARMNIKRSWWARDEGILQVFMEEGIFYEIITCLDQKPMELFFVKLQVKP